MSMESERFRASSTRIACAMMLRHLFAVQMTAIESIGRLTGIPSRPTTQRSGLPLPPLHELCCDRAPRSDSRRLNPARCAQPSRSSRFLHLDQDVAGADQFRHARSLVLLARNKVAAPEERIGTKRVTRALHQSIPSSP